MVKVTYDFREGLDSEKIVYRNTSMDCKSVIYYILYLIFAWSWVVAFFALFHYAYIYHEPTAFWAYIGVWIAFCIFLGAIIVFNLIHHYKTKRINNEKRAIKDAERKQIELNAKEAKERKQKERDRDAMQTNNDNRTFPTGENALLQK